MTSTVYSAGLLAEATGGVKRWKGLAVALLRGASRPSRRVRRIRRPCVLQSRVKASTRLISSFRQSGHDVRKGLSTPQPGRSQANRLIRPHQPLARGQPTDRGGSGGGVAARGKGSVPSPLPPPTSHGHSSPGSEARVRTAARRAPFNPRQVAGTPHRRTGRAGLPAGRASIRQ